METEEWPGGQVAGNVRFHMAGQQVTKETVREALGISSGVMSTRWAGDTKWTPNELEQLAELLNVPLDHLTSLDGPHGPRVEPQCQRCAGQAVISAGAMELLIAEIDELRVEVLRNRAANADVTRQLSEQSGRLDRLRRDLLGLW